MTCAGARVDPNGGAMQQFEAVMIDRPVSAIWALVGDVNGWTKWLPDVSELSPVAEGEISPMPSTTR